MKTLKHILLGLPFFQVTRETLPVLKVACVLAAIGIPIAAMIVENKDAIPPIFMLPTIILLISSGISLFGIIMRSDWNMMLGKERTKVDERQADLQNRAKAFAYQSLFGGIGVFLGCRIILDAVGVWDSKIETSATTLILIMLATFKTLPVAYLAWTVKPAYKLDEDGLPTEIEE